MKNKTILIAGAGPGGLTLAYWLKRHGFVPTLVEKHPDLRTGGYKIDIRGVALDVVRRMGAHDAIFKARTEMRGTTSVDSNGKQVTTMSADLAGWRVDGDIEIMRGDLCQILFDQVADVECLFGDSITQITEGPEGVHVTFEHGPARPFDLVVGADGLHSTVRKLVFGSESQFLHELGFYISFYTVSNFLNLDRWEIEYLDLKQWKYIQVFSTHGDPQAKACFAFPSDALQFDYRNRKQQQELLKHAYAGIGWEAPRFLAAMESSPDFYFDTIAQIRMPHWSQGRVSLVGDAGYCPSPLSGQGTSLALVGAYVLAGELTEAQGDQTAAFSSYETLLRTFVEKNQKLAIDNAKMMKRPGLLKLFNLLGRLMPASWTHLFKRWGQKQVHTAATALTLKNY